MRLAVLLSLLMVLVAPAHAMPLEPVADAGVRFVRPEGWTSLVERSRSSLTLSEGLFTSLFVQWFPLPPAFTGPFADEDKLSALRDESIGIAQETLEEQIPIGRWVEVDRHTEGRDGVATLTYGLLGYQLQVAVRVRIDPHRGRATVAFLTTSADRFAEVDGHAIVAAVVDNVYLDDDPPGPFLPWVWPLDPPPALAAP